jgi:hypothetical protein
MIVGAVGEACCADTSPRDPSKTAPTSRMAHSIVLDVANVLMLIAPYSKARTAARSSFRDAV